MGQTPAALGVLESRPAMFVCENAAHSLGFIIREDRDALILVIEAPKTPAKPPTPYLAPDRQQGAGGRTKLGERSGELRAALWPHQFGALDGDRQHDPAESSWGHLKPDGAVAAVLRPHDEHLGHAVQLSGVS